MSRPHSPPTGPPVRRWPPPARPIDNEFLPPRAARFVRVFNERSLPGLFIFICMRDPRVYRSCVVPRSIVTSAADIYAVFLGFLEIGRISRGSGSLGLFRGALFFSSSIVVDLGVELERMVELFVSWGF